MYKTIAISQPRYLPALNYIERLKKVDLFIVLDTVRHNKQSFEHRNRIKSPQGPLWLSIPLNRAESSSTKIMDLKIKIDDLWRRKHLQTFHNFYKNAPFFEEVFPFLEEFYSQTYETLNSACASMLEILVFYFEIQTKIIHLSEYKKEFHSSGDDLLVDISEYFNAQNYVSGPNGRDYIDEKKFFTRNIDLYFDDYNHPTYKQLWGDFIPYMSIFDAMLLNGKNTLNMLDSSKLVRI